MRHASLCRRWWVVSTLEAVRTGASPAPIACYGYGYDGMVYLPAALSWMDSNLGYLRFCVVSGAFSPTVSGLWPCRPWRPYRGVRRVVRYATLPFVNGEEPFGFPCFDDCRESLPLSPPTPEQVSLFGPMKPSMWRLWMLLIVALSFARGFRSVTGR